jgi:hypothetical protein
MGGSGRGGAVACWPGFEETSFCILGLTWETNIRCLLLLLLLDGANHMAVAYAGAMVEVYTVFVCKMHPARSWVGFAHAAQAFSQLPCKRIQVDPAISVLSIVLVCCFAASETVNGSQGMKSHK